jgi:hypothetical protein
MIKKLGNQPYAPNGSKEEGKKKEVGRGADIATG